MRSVRWTTGAGLSGNFSSNTGRGTSRYDKFIRGLDHLEKCLFSEPGSGCYNQKSFMQHAFLALQIQLFFDGDIANYGSTAHDPGVWRRNQIFLLVHFKGQSALRRSRMNPPEMECLNLIFSTTCLYWKKKAGGRNDFPAFEIVNLPSFKGLFHLTLSPPPPPPPVLLLLVFLIDLC